MSVSVAVAHIREHRYYSDDQTDRASPPEKVKGEPTSRRMADRRGLSWPARIDGSTRSAREYATARLSSNRMLSQQRR